MKKTSNESRLGRFSYLLNGGAKPRRNHVLMIALVLVAMLSFAGVVSADNYWKGAAPSQAITGTVTGDVDAKFANTWKTDNPINNDNTTATFSGLTTSDVQFARLYIVPYTASMTENWQGTLSVTLTPSGGTPVVLANKQPLDLAYVNSTGMAPNTSVSSPLVKLNRVTSDYVAVFDVTNYITASTVTLDISTTNVSGRFDGRIKEAKLVYGWNQAGGSQTKYWINEGQDPSTKDDPSYVGVTNFNGIPDLDYITSATLYTDDIASANGVYTWNSASVTPSTIGSNSYARLNQFTPIDPADIDTDNDFTYDRAGTNSWYKLAVAILKVKY
ncbi:DUF3344 domain-containing protein [Methanoregula sp.]|uniref:DUF3344 domain-containing protein n=1 Tax=Methanoregula sp. TaxID=2052170 RepID=UPI003566B35A